MVERSGANTYTWLCLAMSTVALAALTMGGCSRPTRQQTQTPITPGKARPAPTTAPEAAPTSTPAGEAGQDQAKKAPAFTLTDIDKGTHSLGDYGGKILVLDFWATYCKPCVKRLREYAALCGTYKPKGVEFLGASMDDSDEVIGGWRKKNYEDNGVEFPFPLARVDDATRTAFFGNVALVAIPQTRIIDRKGMIRYSLGPDSTKEDISSALEALLGEKK